MVETNGNEEWRDIPGFPGYAISSIGRIKRTFPVQGAKSDHIMKCSQNKTGHLYVRLRLNGRYHKAYIHRMVLLAFSGQPGLGQEGRHLDGNPHNNHKSNLQWGTRLENCNDMRIHGTILAGSKNHRASLTENEVVSVLALHKRGWGSTRLGKAFCISESAIRKILYGVRWRHIPR
jgi:hypothetical protein